MSESRDPREDEGRQSADPLFGVEPELGEPGDRVDGDAVVDPASVPADVPGPSADPPGGAYHERHLVPRPRYRGADIRHAALRDACTPLHQRRWVIADATDQGIGRCRDSVEGCGSAGTERVGGRAGWASVFGDGYRFELRDARTLAELGTFDDETMARRAAFKRLVEDGATTDDLRVILMDEDGVVVGAIVDAALATWAGAAWLAR